MVFLTRELCCCWFGLLLHGGRRDLTGAALLCRRRWHAATFHLLAHRLRVGSTLCIGPTLCIWSRLALHRLERRQAARGVSVSDLPEQPVTR